MNLGVYIDAHIGVDEPARRIEAAGFSHLWIYDSPLVFGEPYLAALRVLQATTRLIVGPGVTHPGSRPPVATAQALATLNKAAPGRVVFGIGTGSSARHSMRMRPASLRELHEYIRVVRGLLDGDEPLYHEDGQARPIAFIHREGRWIELGPKVETWVSAFGPGGQAAAARVADGVIVRWEGPERMEATRQRISEAARAAGRDPGDVKLGTLYAVYPIDDESELESEDAIEALGPLVISRLRYLTANYQDPAEVPQQLREAFVEYHRYRARLDDRRRHLENYEGYLTFIPDHLRRFVTPETMRAVCRIGDAAAIAQELTQMKRVGVSHAGLQIVGPPAAWCERMGSDVLPRLE